MGSAFAINALGRAFETGELVTKDMSRAVACYQVAAKKGSKGSIAHLERLNKQTAEITKASYCY
jgi:TPR repeat protein